MSARNPKINSPLRGPLLIVDIDHLCLYTQSVVASAASRRFCQKMTPSQNVEKNSFQFPLSFQFTLLVSTLPTPRFPESLPTLPFHAKAKALVWPWPVLPGLCLSSIVFDKCSVIFILSSNNRAIHYYNEEDEEEWDRIGISIESNLIDEPIDNAGSVFKGIQDIPVLQCITDNNDSWWLKLKEPIPKARQCKNEKCKFAPPGHKSHISFARNYSIPEIRLIIQYLIYYDEIHNGKGLRVWDEMHCRGYMVHRTSQSLNNNFKRIILRDIKLFRLPKDIETKFLELRV